MIKIVVLDTNTVTNGDVSLEKITKLGDVSFFDMMPYDKLADIIGDADAVICNKANIDRNLMDKCPNLKYIGLFATGYNNIDTIAAKEKGIAVCNVPGYSTDSVAQTVFAFILHFATSVDMYNNSVQNGDWVISKTFSYFSFPLTEIAGKTLGIYGFGTIGKKVATIAKAFDMNVIAVSHKPQQYDGVTFVSKEELFKQSDYLSIHCPLTPETKCIVNEQTLKLMKKS
ncbi:MAG: D-2-hydroxyacid dehydrogenase, partial [Clostridia bacterium]|nr:D-2-hydroxyacid dehydrogenase [Clostridia bacterium]